MEEIGTSIASKIVEKPVALIGRQLSYLIYYHFNIQRLKDVLKNLDDKKNDVQRSMDAAKRNGATIKDQVQNWLEDVSKIFLEAEELQTKLNVQTWCPSLKSRYSLSRKAKKIAQCVLNLKLDQELSNNVANPTPLQQLGSIISSEGFKGFESRKAVMNDVLSALRNEKTRIIGICGMGGVGKTTMVREIKEVITRLEGTNKLFDDVVIATVSATVNIKTIQTEIAESLGMKFVEESESIRAKRLHERIKDSKRILIILDDVWSKLKFEVIGIPFGVGPNYTNQVHGVSKILLTSRDEEVCKVMGCKDNIFRVQALNEKEAWELFMATVGECLDNNLDLLHTAKLIADECKGLPIAIITIGKTLLSIDKNEWDAVHDQMKNSLPENIPGMEPEVYSCIKLSYDKLESDEVKSCFLLCCLFPEDYDVPTEYLVRYGLGRAIFGNINSVENARKRVHFFIGQLKRRFLLLDSLKKECIKMHDIVRDVAISIASKDPHRFMVRSCGGGEWPGVQKATNQEHCSAISLIDAKLDEDIIDGLDYPKLELLQLKNSSSISEYSNHFKRLRELKVLAFLGMDMSSYLASNRSLALREPKYLHTLCLENCKLGDISHVIGGLEKLEILSFARSQINKLPREIGLLHRLRMLDATDCKGLEEIPHGVLSNLRRLEELYMAKSFLNWGPTVGSKDETSMASLDEVTSLSVHLKVLAIEIHDGQMLRNGFLLKNEHIRFYVSINTSRSHREIDPFYARPGYLFEKSLMLYGDVTKYMEIGTVRNLLKQSEDLSLHRTYYLKSLMQSDDQGGFQHLKVLSIMFDKNIEYLMNGTDWTRQHPAFPNLKSATFNNVNKLKVVCHGKLPDKHSFMNLRSIAIDKCHELKYVFSLSVAQNLVQLQSLRVDKCAKVEEIISKERMEDDDTSHRITFPRLTVLKLSVLRKLCGFYTGNQRDSTYEIIKPNDESVNKMKETRNDNQVAGSTSSKSNVAQVGASCNALFPSNCISWLPNLEELVLEEFLRSTQGSEENSEPVVNMVFDLEGHVSAFSQLQTLQARYLYEVEHLWKNVQPGFQGFQNVRSLTIRYCNSLKYLCSYEIYKLLVNLQQVEISFCENMETIVLAAASTDDNIHEEGKETGGSGAMTLFPKLLNRFVLLRLPNLERFCHDAYSFAWSSSTRSMHVRNCRKLKTLGFAPVSKKLPAVAENLSDDHVRGSEELGSRCASSTGSGFGCAPLVCLQSRPSTHNFTQILPRPVNREVTLANLQTSTATHNLEHLHVEMCNFLEVIFLVQETPSTQAFDKLGELQLEDLPMLSHIWEKGLQVSSGFGNLRLLGVWGCENLRYLFSPHIAKLLTCLETIEVSSCSAMEKIVGEAEGGGESIEDELTFPHVNYISLSYLPKLESFCSQAYTLKWPALEKVKVRKCRKLKAFAPPDSMYV